MKVVITTACETKDGVARKPGDVVELPQAEAAALIAERKAAERMQPPLKPTERK